MNFLNKVYEGRLGLLVNAMVAENGITKAELEELNEIIRLAESEENQKHD